jgi:SAM-dependent methyltransferase
VRWPLQRRVSRGRLPSLGQDYKEGHDRYVERLGAGAGLWLRTKPFGASPGHELRESLHTFAHLVDQLGLGVRAQVLDVGCGPGWLSEFLARCGYWVTGVDVSEAMVGIARERIAAIDEPVGIDIEALAEFHAMPVREMPWRARFDAAILYDAMHHFDDEVKTLRVIRRTLAPGGRIFIHEGVRPAPGSEGERILIAEMEEYGTLEAPFDPKYLEAVLTEAGFAQVTRFAAVNELLDVSAGESELQRVEVLLKNPQMNTVIASNPVPAELPGADRSFASRIETEGAWRVSPDGQQLSLPITLMNAGRGYWPAVADTSVPYGVVTLGPYLPTDDGGRIELPRMALLRSLASGESAAAEIQVPVAGVQGRREVAIDLVREGIAWFADYGSTPLVVPLPGEG